MVKNTIRRPILARITYFFTILVYLACIESIESIETIESTDSIASIESKDSIGSIQSIESCIMFFQLHHLLETLLSRPFWSISKNENHRNNIGDIFFDFSQIFRNMVSIIF